MRCRAKCGCGEFSFGELKVSLLRQRNVTNGWSCYAPLFWSIGKGHCIWLLYYTRCTKCPTQNQSPFLLVQGSSLICIHQFVPTTLVVTELIQQRRLHALISWFVHWVLRHCFVPPAGTRLLWINGMTNRVMKHGYCEVDRHQSAHCRSHEAAKYTRHSLV